MTGITLLRPSGFGAALFQISDSDVTITSDDTGIMEGQYNSAYASMIEVVAGGELTVSNITMQNAERISPDGTGGSQGGAISVKGGGKLTCQDVTFTGNTVTGNAAGENYYNGGGAVYASDSKISIIDCEFTGNSSVFGNGGAIYADNNTTGVISGNTITGSEAQKTKGDTDGFGGAIYCRLADEMTISDNTITDSKAQNDGGGIAILTTDDSSKITLADNTISNNISEERGGGLYLVQNAADTIDLQSGVISGNYADWGGGIDYTVHSQETLHLTNVVITGNTAVRGGGIWACPTAETESNATLGGAIYSNTATGNTNGVELNPIYASGDDIRYEGEDADEHNEDKLILKGNPWISETTIMTVMKRTLGGGVMQWYQDEQKDRYQAGDGEADPSLYTETKKSFSLHGELSETYRELAAAEAKLIIKDNTAESRGGGIATNSPVVIGMEGADKSVTVTKQWQNADGSTIADTSGLPTVTVDLYRVDSVTGERVPLDQDVELNASNKWSVTFSDLPAYYENDEGNHCEYTYEVKENPLTGWETVSTQITPEATPNHTYITLVNKPAKADLTVIKVTADNDAPADNQYAFSATVGDKNETFTLSNVGIKTFDGLAAGTAYSVEETDSKGYVSACVTGNAAGTINETADDQIVLFLNSTKELNALFISKTVEGEDPAEGTKEFTFDVTLPAGTYTYYRTTNDAAKIQSETLDCTDGTGSLKLKSGESVVICNLPVGAEYSVTEQVVNNYVTDVEVTGATAVEVGTNTVSGTIPKAGTVPGIHYTNTYTPAGTITVTPADITIYMGGDDGYDAVVGGEDAATGTVTSANSLPRPMFLIDAPEGVKPEDLTFTSAEKLIDSSGNEVKDESGNPLYKTWTLTEAGKTSTDESTAKTLYYMNAKYATQGQDEVRVQYVDKKTGAAITNDLFDPTSVSEMYVDYFIRLYTGTVETSGITVKDNNGTDYKLGTLGAGTLRVRAVDDTEEGAKNPVTQIVTEGQPIPELEPGKGAVTAPAGTTYTLNDTTVPVSGTGVGLLFDGIIDDKDNDRTGALEDKVDDTMGPAASNVTRHYQAQYLDLVDANNGNAWVKASGEVTVYWGYPSGTDKNTKFTLYHFKGLHRDDNGGQSGFNINDVNSAEVEEVKNISKDDNGISFKVGSGGFSPFVLVWETTNSGGGGGGGGHHDKPEDLNTEDHFAYIIGYPGGTVQPQGDITRAEVATIFFRMLTDEARAENWSQTNNYTDVAPADWYNNAISTLTNMGIISGEPDGSFRPNDPITRAEFTKIAVGFFEEAGNYVEGTFVDVPANAWYADFIDAAVDLGLIEGYPDGTIRPEATITRAEACTIVNRTLGRVPDKDHLLPEEDMVLWPDNSDVNAWYYAQMQEATNSHDYEWTGEGDEQVENWTEKLEDRDWDALETEWSEAGDAPGGEVMD